MKYEFKLFWFEPAFKNSQFTRPLGLVLNTCDTLYSTLVHISDYRVQLFMAIQRLYNDLFRLSQDGAPELGNSE